MKIVEFYRGERANVMGNKLEDIMMFTHGQLEMDHDYVQWLFPSNEPSMLNGDAPCLTKQEAEIFLGDPILQSRIFNSFEKMLGFLGFSVCEDYLGNIVIDDIAESDENPNPQRWMGSFNHNCLRVTRIIKCLRLVGLDEYASAFYKALQRHENNFSPNTWSHWHNAISCDLWDAGNMFRPAERLFTGKMTIVDDDNAFDRIHE